MQESGRYTIQAEIASGSTATVFLAEDSVLRRKVALKKLHPHLLNHPEAVKRFKTEAVAVASLSHENIVRVYDFGDEARNLYLAMEYVDGPSLESLIAAHAPLPGRVCMSLFHQVLKGLAAAHDAGIVHRDIKPSNLLLDRKGGVRLADFGIALLLEEAHITRTGSYLGTPVYSAPEQARGLSATAKSDIFSAGILFFRCLAGRLPFDGESPQGILNAILEKSPPRLVQLNHRALPGLPELVDRMLAKDPARRPTASGCREELEAVSVRHGLAIEPERIRRFAQEPAGYAAEENVELAHHFLEQARRAESSGQPRAAVKLAALAELHFKSRGDTPPDIGRIRTNWEARNRRRALALLSAAMLAAAVAWMGFSGPPRGEEPARGAADPAAAPSRDPQPAGEGTLKDIAPVDTLPPAAQALREEPAPGRKASPASRRILPVSRKPVPAPGAPGKPHSAVSADPAVAAPQPGRILVKTNPPFARVLFQGRELGITPFKVPVELPAGTHELLVEREGCLPHRAQVVVEPGALAQVRLVLDRAHAASR